MVEFFKNLSFIILPLGFGSKRIEFFENQIRKFGGSLAEVGEKAMYVIVEDSVCEERSNFLSALKNHGIKLTKDVKYVRVKWVSKCLSGKRLVDCKNFEIEWGKEEVESSLENFGEYSGTEKRQFEGETNNNQKFEECSGKKQKIENEDYICSQPSSSSQGELSQTKKIIIEELEKLANAYGIRNDTWRSHSYRKAVNAIMLYPKEITTFQEACNIPGIGEKMALKIMEIIESGKLTKVDEIIDEKTKILDLFCKIWGVGPSSAESWYRQGFRSLEDLKEKAKLTKQQIVGLKYYEDFQKRIPKEEVIEIAEIVKQELTKIGNNLRVEIVGSFRRGKPTCGDIDLMIVNPGVKTAGDILLQLTDSLRSKGYLTDDLVTLEDIEEGNEDEKQHKKYFGVFKLPEENKINRRIDLFVVPISEEAAALFHYTGSALFNRSIKLLAAKKQMALTEHGLYIGTVRKGSEVMNKGQLVSTLSEEEIFRELGLPYRLPEERDH